MAKGSSDHESPPPSRVGTVIAQRYRLVSQLGEGGIGVVYLADDLALRTRVAVKLLKQELSEEPEVLARFEREASAMTALAHEHIVQALNFGRAPEGDICLVMEYVQGETLRTTLNRLKPFPLHGGVDISRQIGSALDRAHSLGIVHRDLKPENVMVTWMPDGRPWIKVLDFGMARILGGTFGPTSPLTRKGAVFGTPEYMPPEQAMGRPVEARADQYALGVMLFEMLAGRRPFRADTALDMVQMQIHEPPPVLANVVPGLPREVSDVVARMMAKPPDGRFPDVATAMQALTTAAFPPRASPSTPPGRPLSKPPTNPPATPPHAGATGPIPNVLGDGAAPGTEADAAGSGRKWWKIFGRS